MAIDWKELARERAKKTFSEDEIETYLCPATAIELGFCVGDETFSFTSCGTCYECGMDFHYSALRMADDVSQPSWPIHYLGYYCKTCYYADDDKDDVEPEEPIEFEPEEEEAEPEETEESEESANPNL